jgi:hypothetical protein
VADEPVSPVRDFLRTYLISPAFFDKFFGKAPRLYRAKLPMLITWTNEFRGASERQVKLLGSPADLQAGAQAPPLRCVLHCPSLRSLELLYKAGQVRFAANLGDAFIR